MTVQEAKKESFLHRLVPKGRGDVDMTEGNIVRHLIGFALPLLVGNLFQQLYNTVDAWVVGNYVSNEAFSAVGTVTPIINLLIGFFTGLATGAGVVISQHYGARKFQEVERAVHTAIVMTLVLGVLFTLIGVGMTPFMLRFMKTPADVFPQSKLYLTIYFSGILALMFYNMGAGILRAVGDSRKPFYFLLFSSVVNTIMDLVLVLGFHMGVEGVALGTIIAEAASAILVLTTLLRTHSVVRVSLRKLRMDLTMMKKILQVGLPVAIQMAVTSFSNVFVQSYINVFGADAMAGWTAHNKLDQLILLPMQSMALACTTFVGQNLGRGLEPRARQGIRTTMILSEVVTVALMIPLLLFAPQMVAFFNSKPEVVEYGARIMLLVCPFYVLCVINQVLAGALRGSGNSKAPTFIMLASFVLFRQIYLAVISRVLPGMFAPVALGYPAGWLVCSTLMLIYYKRTQLTLTRVVD